MAGRIIRAEAAFSVARRRRWERRGLREPRRQEGSYLKLIASLPCVLSGRSDGVQAAHIRFPWPTLGKPLTGMSEKPHDMWTLPLHWQLHQDQHANPPEEEWWGSWGIFPIALCTNLYGSRQNEAWMREILHIVCPTDAEALTRMTEIFRRGER